MRPWSEAELRAPAIVISPHQDDETLGCGATIAAKRKAGAKVKIVFMTDGSGSHAHLLDREQLSNLRRQEALAAAKVLDVEPGDVYFLDFPDGDLLAHEREAVDALRRFLTDNPAEQIFVPYRGDWTSDHLVTVRVFYQAVADIDRHFQVFEYPVWFWTRWPFAPKDRRRGIKRLLAQTRDAAKWTWALRFQLRAYAAPPEAQQAKRRALEQHQTQTARKDDNPDWAVLADVAGGEFINCFQQGFEVFYRKHI